MSAHAIETRGWTMATQAPPSQGRVKELEGKLADVMHALGQLFQGETRGLAVPPEKITELFRGIHGL